jgi:hypothetical protein
MPDLVHPRKRAARARYYPHTVTIKAMVRRTGEETDASGLVDLPCAYRPAVLNSQPRMMQSEANSYDQVAMNGLYTGIAKKAFAIITFKDGSTKRVQIIDNLTLGIDGDQTLLLVTPDQ